MKEILLFAIVGLGTGTLTAARAVAVILTYRDSGVVNLTSRTMAMNPSSALWMLRFGLPGPALPAPLAVLGKRLLSVALSVGVEAVVFRQLRADGRLLVPSYLGAGAEPAAGIFGV